MRRVVSVLLLSATVAGSAAAAPAGMVSSLSGKAEVRSGGGAWKPVRLMQRLESGDAVRCAAGAELVVILFESAERYKVPASGSAVVEANSVKGASKIAEIRGPGIRIAKGLGGSRVDGFMARPAQSHQRLTPTFPGWMLEGERHFTWNAIPGADTYSFSLFDAHDNVVWSARVSGLGAHYPADLPYFALRRPYVWRLAPFSKSGKPVMGARWGFLTFLAKPDADQLTAEVAELDAAAKAESGDTTALVLLAELYRSYGVLGKTLETLESPQVANQPGIREAQEEVFQQAGRYAQMLRPAATAGEAVEQSP